MAHAGTPLKHGKIPMNRKGLDTSWHIAGLGAVVVFIGSAIAVNSGFFYVCFMDDFGINRETASWPTSVGTVTSSLSGMAALLVEPWLSVQAIILFGSIIQSAGVIASSFAPNITWMTVTLGVVHGIGNGVATLMVSLLALMYFDRYRGIATGLKYVGGTLCSLAFPHIVLYLDQMYDYRGTLLILGGIYLHVTVAGLLLKEPSWIAQEKKLQSLTSKESGKGQTKERFLHYFTMLKSPFFYALFASSLVFDFTKSAYMTTLVDYGIDKGFTIDESESVISYTSFGELGGFLLLPLVSDRKYISRACLYMLAFLFLGIGISLQPLTSDYGTFIVTAMVARLSMGSIMTMKTVLVGDYFGAERLIAFWTLAGMGTIPFILLTPSIIGYFRDTMGSYDGFYWLQGGLHFAIGSAFLVFVCLERRRREFVLQH